MSQNEEQPDDMPPGDRKRRTPSRPWTRSEEATLTRLHAALGNAWSSISRELRGRTSMDVKNIFFSTVRSTRLKGRSLLRTYVARLRNRFDNPEARKAAYRYALRLHGQDGTGSQGQARSRGQRMETDAEQGPEPELDPDTQLPQQHDSPQRRSSGPSSGAMEAPAPAKYLLEPPDHQAAPQPVLALTPLSMSLAAQSRQHALQQQYQHHHQKQQRHRQPVGPSQGPLEQPPLGHHHPHGRRRRTHQQQQHQQPEQGYPAGCCPEREAGDAACWGQPVAVHDGGPDGAHGPSGPDGGNVAALPHPKLSITSLRGTSLRPPIADTDTPFHAPGWGMLDALQDVPSAAATAATAAALLARKAPAPAPAPAPAAATSVIRFAPPSPRYAADGSASAAPPGSTLHPFSSRVTVQPLLLAPALLPLPKEEREVRHSGGAGVGPEAAAAAPTGNVGGRGVAGLERCPVLELSRSGGLSQLRVPAEGCGPAWERSRAPDASAKDAASSQGDEGDVERAAAGTARNQRLLPGSSVALQQACVGRVATPASQQHKSPCAGPCSTHQRPRAPPRAGGWRVRCLGLRADRSGRLAGRGGRAVPAVEGAEQRHGGGHCVRHRLLVRHTARRRHGSGACWAAAAAAAAAAVVDGRQSLGQGAGGAVQWRGWRRQRPVGGRGPHRGSRQRQCR
ncbi:hypothetical protein Agub_g10153 [Astrephomene gubernaculifera]|uniref:Uncharacterized protein n=1 Tax=Astrephomene gubernaculifera TaxID=47775 RepID=A0AAD3DUR8_9CHLO|nr:hypothetical protein Agub_g10153 [Astrephomene gubernaculifera]